MQKKPRQFRIAITKNVVINGTQKAEGLDLSEAGMYIYTKASFTPGSIIHIEFMLNNEPVKVSAAVEHSQPGIGVGVRFTGIEKEPMTAIKGFLSKLKEQ